MRQAYRGVHSSSAFAFWVPAAFVFSQTPADDGEGLLLTVIALDVVNGRIQAIRSVANPNNARPSRPDIFRTGGRIPLSEPTPDTQSTRAT